MSAAESSQHHPVVTAVVPFRADAAGERVRNLVAVVAQLQLGGIPVIVSEESPRPDPRLDSLRNVDRVFIRSDDAFSKARACNAGWARVHAPVVAFVDADTVVDADILRGAAVRIARTDEVIRPFGRFRELDEFERASYLETGTLPDASELATSDTRGGEHIPPTGGAVLLSTDRYLAVGGMDETFIGWGGEDDAFATALARSGARLLTVPGATAFHLWHPRSQRSRYAHANYAANVARSEWWRLATEDERVAVTTASSQRLAAIRR